MTTYQGEHSIIFGDKHTWDDWFLIPSSRPVFKPPEPKTTYYDIPGADGHLDMSTALTGDIPYKNRTGSIEFIVDNGHKDWHELYSEIMDYLHGQKMRAILTDDMSFYYEGRFAVNEWKSDPDNSKITIDYDVHPYKFEMLSSLEDWKWDPFNFEVDIVREYGYLTVDGSLTVNIPGRRKNVTPSIEVHSYLGDDCPTVSFNGTTYSLSLGTNKIVNIILKEGNNTLTFNGRGVISIDYRGGRL